MNVRTIVWAATFMALAAGSAAADYAPTEIAWPGWRVASSEDLYLGVRHTSYPLTHLFDGQADTAWAPSGKAKALVYKDRTVLVLAPDKPVSITSLRLMTGYNKSDALFEKNDRAAEIRITVNGENYLGVGQDAKPYTKTTRLKDSPGWHTVKVEGPKVRCLTLEILQRHKGATGDLCLSELELYNGDTRIDMAMPEVVRFTKGDECGCNQTHEIIRRDGTRICRDNGEEMGEGAGYGASGAAWSPTHRYVAGIDYTAGRKEKAALYVIEAATGQVVLRRPVDVAGCAITWKGDGFVRVTYYTDEDPPKGPAPSRTFKVPTPVAVART
jgi:hypothetical protein